MEQILANIFSEKGLVFGLFASASDTRRGTNIGGNIFDTNGAITPAGSKTMTQTVSGSGNGGVVMASFSPVVTANSNFLMFF